MANNGEIVIRIEEGSVEPKPLEPEEQKKKDSAGLLETAALVYCLKRAAESAKAITIEEVKYQINRHFRLTDDYISQQNLNIALGVVSKTKNAALGALGTFKALGGGGAGILGAITAAGIAVVQTGVQIVHNYEEEKLRLNKMNAELSFNRQRAGYSLTAGSVGENR